jgi:hypothetical protein
MEINRQPNDGWDWSKIEENRTHLAPWELTLTSHSSQSIIEQLKLYAKVMRKTKEERAKII